MRSAWKLGAALCLGLLVAGPRPATAADDAKMAGTWKLVLVPTLQELDFLVFDVTGEGASLSAKVEKAQALFPSKPSIEKLTVKGDAVRFDMRLQGADHPFVGTLGKGGEVRGTLQLQGNLLPARLERSENGQLKEFGVNAKLSRAYIATRQDKDPKSRSAGLKALAVEVGDSPMSDVLYEDLLATAGKAGLTEEEVRGLADKWLAISKPYGETYTATVQARIAKALTGQKPYAGLAFELATAADKALAADATTEARASAARGLADAARLAGKADVAAVAEARAVGLEKTLDDEYRKTVPPFKPTPYAGRKAEGADRVVLMELFTGAECPPCVAADVAFDALIHAYKPAEVIGLQYHLHIPGPDPLTNADSIARQEYYPDIQGTPSVFFNGKTFPGGGGPMAGAEAKFAEYGEAISKELEGKKAATIGLKVARSGDEIKIAATATASDARPEAKLRLRLAIIEEEVRYRGGNRLRLHHHVVRAFLGGVAGHALADGKGAVEATVKIPAIRKDLETYLDDFAKANGSFSTRPPIALEKLSVVAFVQDDGDKSILDARLAPVGEAKP